MSPPEDSGGEVLPSCRLVAFDLDGTLLKRDWTISSRNQEAIKAVQAKGVMVTIATGRMFASAVRYAELLGLTLPLITYHGALVTTSHEAPPVYQRFLPKEYARSIVTRVKDLGYAINLYFGDDLYVEKLSEATLYYLRQSGVNYNLVSNLLDLLDRDPIKLVVVNEEKVLDILAEESREKWGDAVYITKSEPIYLEYMHPDANKGKALEALARHLGVAREQTMVFGDSYNDLEMFKYAGTSVAMGNARKEIQAAADYITTSNEEDGVALALEKLIL